MQIIVQLGIPSQILHNQAVQTDLPTQLHLSDINTSHPLNCLQGEENPCNECASPNGDIPQNNEVPTSENTCNTEDSCMHISKTSNGFNILNEETKLNESNIAKKNSSNLDPNNINSGKDNDFYKYSKSNPTNVPLNDFQNYGLHEYFR